MPVVSAGEDNNLVSCSLQDSATHARLLQVVGAKLNVKSGSIVDPHGLLESIQAGIKLLFAARLL